MPAFREEQLTSVAAVLFILSVGLAASLSSRTSLLTLSIFLTGVAFVYLYVRR